MGHEVGMQTGADFDIFQDRSHISWGENWRSRIEESLDEVTFLIPIITPSFFSSQACRQELQRFLEREEALERNDLILPIYYVDTPQMNLEDRREADEVAQAVHAHQYADWRELRNRPPSHQKVRATLTHLARQIHDALERVRSQRAADNKAVASSVESVGQSDRNGSKGEVVHLAVDWTAVITELKKRRQALTAAVYEEAQVEHFDGEVLRLLFPEEQDFYVSMARNSKHSEVLGEVLEEQLGSKPRLVIRAANLKTSIDESSRRTSKVAQQWDKVMKELKKDRHSLAATIYGEASVESVDEEAVHLGFSKGQNLYVTMASKSENKRKLSKALEKVTGERLSIEAAISSDLP